MLGFFVVDTLQVIFVRDSRSMFALLVEWGDVYLKKMKGPNCFFVLNLILFHRDCSIIFN